MTPPPIRLPSGVRDFLPRAAARRRFLAGQVMDLFEAWGYAQIITPAFECADVLERGLGPGAKAAAIRFVEPASGEVVALRPDMTPQIARIVATRLAAVPGPIRLCYEGAVTRLAGEAGQREILQAGIELIHPAPDSLPGSVGAAVGSDSASHAAAGRAALPNGRGGTDPAEVEGDAEVLALATEVLSRLSLGETRLDVGHVAPVRYVLGTAPDDDARQAVIAALARKDRSALRSAALALPEPVRPLAEALVGLWGHADATIERARKLAWPTDVVQALNHVERATAGLAGVTVDFGDLRGFDYYTGIRFAAFASAAPDAILRGGRYDQLVGRYGRPARAVGFAIDLEAIAQAQRAIGIAVPVGAPGVAVADPALAAALRAAGFRAVHQSMGGDTAAEWLRGVGFDVAFVGQDMIRADGSQRSAASEIQAATAGDIAPLIALLRR